MTYSFARKMWLFGLGILFTMVLAVEVMSVVGIEPTVTINIVLGIMWFVGSAIYICFIIKAHKIEGIMKIDNIKNNRPYNEGIW